MTNDNRASGPTAIPFAINAARQAGYSDAEIVQHIAGMDNACLLKFLTTWLCSHPSNASAPSAAIG
jgi:hypothetical protein